MELTLEQKEITSSEEENILVIAKAGTGKTTTLIKYAEKRPLNTFLYLVYNKENKKSSKRKFFGNTTVHTIHSLAYKEIGYMYEDKLLKRNINLNDIINGIDSLKKEFNEDNQDVFIKAGIILQILENFFSSAKTEIKYTEYDEEANEYWEKMKDISNKEVLMMHDGYLKLFQLIEPELKYDYIMVDEAQDSNEVMLDIVMKQNTKKIWVGDEDQEIYGFRNSHNIFKNELFKDYKIFYLTKSFRFGENVAWLANKILKHYKNTKVFVEGLGKDEIILDFEKNEKKTIITRTNAHLFDLAVMEMNKGNKICILGGENFVFNEIEDVYNLYKGNLYKIKNAYIKKFGNFSRLKAISEKTEDMELTFIVKIMEKYKTNLVEILNKLKFSLTGETKANIILTTAHKSKGLEFFNVELAEDFYFLYTKNGIKKEKEQIPYEEINLYYVALTRTMEKIKLNNQLFLFLGEN